MLNIPENVKNTFLEESSHKTLKFTTNPNWLYAEDAEWQKDIDSLNLFNGNAYLNGVTWHYDAASTPLTGDFLRYMKIDRYSNKDSLDATNSVETFAFKYRNYVNISMNIGVYPTSTPYPQQLRFGVRYLDNTGAERKETVTFDVADYLASGEWQTVGRVSITLPTYKLAATGASAISRIFFEGIDNNVDFYGYLIYGRPIISVSDNPDSFPIQYSEVDYTTLDKREYIPFVLFDNENIVFDKFSMTESLCSKDNIEFGLCEAGNIEVDVVNVGDVKDETFYPMIGVADPNADVPYSEMRRINWYKGSRYNPNPAHNTARWENVTANHITNNRIGDIDIASYNEYFLDYPYLYIKYNLSFEYFTADSLPTYIRPKWYFEKSNGVTYTVNGDYIELSELLNNSVENLYKLVNENATGSIDKFTKVEFYFFDANKDALIVSNINARVVMDNVQVGLLNTLSDDIPAFSLDTCYIYNDNLDEYLAQYQYSYVPLGKYTVKDITKKISHNLTVKTLSMYDDMLLLEQNAANWYTQYMYGIDTNEAGNYGYEFARQIYSGYYNYMKNIGIMSEPNDMTLVFTKTYDECLQNMSTKYYRFFEYYNSSQVLKQYFEIKYSQHVISNPDPSKLYMLKKINYNYMTDADLMKAGITWYENHEDPYGRGLVKANVLVEEELSDGTYNRFLVDNDDLFAISNNCVEFTIYAPTYTYGYWVDGSITRTQQVIESISLYSVNKDFTLENASTRLLYYQYEKLPKELEERQAQVTYYVYLNNTHTIFECDSSITGRDVVHSLLELTGCFFRMSRETGEPEFIYCTKSGLYPSNTLYPADDLYPRAGTNQVEGMGKYMSTECADYSVTKFGKIQILKNQTSNKTESNVQWQYIGDEDVGLNTYIIDDNIFYCNKDMTYDTDHMQELDVTLRKMFYMISNMDYTPNITKALGIPWLECGDRLGLLTYDGGFETFVYRRKLDGIQLLKDTYESHGDEYNNAIKNYGY